MRILGISTFKGQVRAAHRKLNRQNNHKHNKKINKENLHFCIVSFISDKWILSDAYCFADPTSKNYFKNNFTKVFAGSNKVSSRHYSNKNFTIERICYHSKFDNSNLVGFDIALVELSERVVFQQKRTQNEFGEQKEPFMNAICLPLKGKKYQFNETARTTGWGLSSAGDIHSMPSKLLTTDILISNQSECVERYTKSFNFDQPRRQMDKYDDFVCAHYKYTRDACECKYKY